MRRESFPFHANLSNILAAAMWVFGYGHVFVGSFKQATPKYTADLFRDGRTGVSNSTGTFTIISM